MRTQAASRAIYLRWMNDSQGMQAPRRGGLPDRRGVSARGREKSIRHGHPSTLHLWWARRPLASSRAVLLALLLPDPCDPHLPGGVQGQGSRALAAAMFGGKSGTTDEDLRKALLRFIGDFANWDNSAQRTYLEVGRALVKAAHAEEPPLVVDPFAGGGSIPLEALRLGCEAFASDLNPVACLILKVMLEDIPRHGPKLAEELRRVGAEIKKAGGEGTGRVLPEGPGRRDAHRLPLGADRALRVAELRRGDPAGAVVLAVQEGEPAAGAATPGRAAGKGERRASSSRSSSRRRRRKCRRHGDARQGDVCLLQHGAAARARAGATRRPARRGGCGVRREGPTHRRGADAGRGDARRRASGAALPAADRRDYEAVLEGPAAVEAKSPRRSAPDGLSAIPDEPVPPDRDVRAFSVQRYGMMQWGDLFTARQKLALLWL